MTNTEQLYERLIVTLQNNEFSETEKPVEIEQYTEESILVIPKWILTSIDIDNICKEFSGHMITPSGLVLS